MTISRTLLPSSQLIRFTLAAIYVAGLFSLPSLAQAKDPVNLVVIFIDDLGYADIGAFGDNKYPTPNLDKMAAEGMKFTDFVTSTAVCSASRAALLTGCYHRRVGIHGALGPGAKRGLNSREMTIAEVAKQQDYVTACFGKWHLGHHKHCLLYTSPSPRDRG